MKKFFVTLALLALSATAFAQPQPPAPAAAGNRTNTEAPAEAKGNGLPFTIDAKVDTSTSYYFRGYKYIDGGYTIQPQLTLSLNPLKVGDVGVAPYVTVWGNITDLKGPKSSWSHLNEIDVDPGVDLTWSKLPNFTLEVQYNAYFYPGGVPSKLRGLEGQSQEIGGTIKYDDSALKLLPVALNPHVSYFVDTHTSAQYLEVGIEPQFKVNDKLSFSVPLLMGDSTNNYYTKGNGKNDFFGYATIGVHPKYKLSEHWDVHANVDYLYLNSASVVSAQGGDRNVFVGGVGIGFSY